MGSHPPRNLIAAALGLALSVAACGGGAAETTTTTTTPPETTTTTTLPEEAVFVVAAQGDDNPVVRAAQFLLVCNGYEQTVVDGLDETLVPDGQYGAITATVVDRVQRDLGLPRDGTTITAMLYERLASTCENTRSFYLSDTVFSLDAGGYASADLPDSWTFSGQPGQRVTLTPQQPPLQMGLYAPDGSEMMAVADTEGFTVAITTAGSHTVKVNSAEPMTYQVTISLPPHFSALLLQSTGLDLADFGDSPTRTIAIVSAILGEPTADTDWTEAGGGCVRWRRVEWGESELWLEFTDSATDALEAPTFNAAGVEHFAAWQINLTADGEQTLPALATPSGLHVGDSAAEATAIYDDRVAIDGTTVSIADGVIIGELDEADGTIVWLRSGATLCTEPDPQEDEGT
ncbi:MAG: peptidoglycan-binding protein [Actinobacteria bacterium]|nr:peptidoglycan-binding protein [Actinomycetota bacterium]MBU1494239.1 peptidoglycan-binding protein [Actinomycetota bacterium]